MIQPCGAARPSLRPANWECTGTGLIIVTTTVLSGERLPVVLPRRALEVIDPQSWWESPLRDFAGGDHLHLEVPARPPGFRGDALLAMGATAVPFKKLGYAQGDGEMFIGPAIEEDRRDR